MNDTLLKVSLAGFLHDIGKFAQRAHNPTTPEGELGLGFFPDKSFIENHSPLFLPSYNGRMTHQHAVFTAAFIDHLAKILPNVFSRPDWGEGDTLMALAAGHHSPKTPGQWAVAMGDRISSGFDRDSFEIYNRAESGEGSFRRTRMLSLFEELSISNPGAPENADAFRLRLAMQKLTPASSFPVAVKEAVPGDEAIAEKHYRDLFQQFVFDLEKIDHRNFPELWLEHFDSLCQIYLGQIPAATVGKTIPDVSLYDHARATAALATAFYAWHEANGSLNSESVQDYKVPALLVIQGSFNGIQDFIFSHGGSTGKASGKLLRGRSFYVSLLSELAADMLLRDIGLTPFNLLMNAAGKFTVLAPNIDSVRQKIEAAEKTINLWLLSQFHGQVSVGICHTPASGDDFRGKHYSELWSRLSREAEEKKFRRFDLAASGGVQTGYLDEFSREGAGLCPFCGKRPARADVKIGIEDDSDNACGPCHDQILIGENLVRHNRIAVTTVDADIRDRKLKTPLLGKYQIGFDVSGRLLDIARAGHLLHYWDISVPEDGDFARDITTRFLNGYVPKYRPEDEHDDRLLAGKKSEKTRLELIEMIKEGVPKSFLHIAKTALNQRSNESEAAGRFEGIEALGVLKADVDNLGLLFGAALPPERMTISRTSALSRQLNFFFAGHLPWKMKSDKRFNDIYTVFSGGDDLFVIGPWNRIIEFASMLNREFSRYAGGNPDITLSAGISVHKPGDSIRTMAAHAEEGVHAAKSAGRNRLSLFDRTVTWKEFEELQKIRGELEQWMEKRWLSSGMLYRFTKFSELAAQEALLKKGEFALSGNDLESLSWRAKFKYAVVRNVSKLDGRDERNQVIDRVLNAAEWFGTYGGAMRIPLWQVLYNHR
ncbi:MAG: type III-A CRISPR-associated protein Cas10/Csm1 [Candidatus Riflebacteria bacterium]|nr:type III-A CRISPR-associated protein Cas10/Csm1 [Candidatus Riflebacteria bacterium]